MNDKPKVMKPLPPFVKFVCANVPMVFDDSLSYYETLSALWKYVSDMTDVINNNAMLEEEYIAKFEELKTFVDTYFDNLDVQEEINNKLDAMAEDGSLLTLIKPLLDNGYYNKSTFIGFTRLMRELIPRSENPNYSSDDYPLMQGGCYVANDRFVQCSLRSGDNDNAQLRVINLTNGDVEREAVLALQHANSVTYNADENKLYITSLTDNSVNTHYVYIVDYATLSIEETFDLTDDLQSTEGTHSISYDPVTKKTILCTEIRGNNELHFYYIDMEDGSLEAITLENYHNMITNNSLHNWANNDICVYNNILYLVKHNPNVIVKFDLESGKCIFIYNAQRFLRYGVQVGELQSISVNPDTEDFYLSSNNTITSGGWYNTFNYLITNFAHGTDCNTLNVGPGDVNVYVDANSTAIDPDGTTSHKYKTIGEALERLNLPEYRELTIYLDEGTYPRVSFINSKYVMIRKLHDDQDETTIKGVYAKGGRFSITGVTIDSETDYDIDLNSTDAKISNVKVDSTKAVNINLYNSNLKAFSIKDENNNFAKIKSSSESLLDAYDDIPDYTLVDALPNLTKDIRVVSGFSGVGSAIVAKSYEGKEAMIENDNATLYLWLTSQAGYVKVPFKGSSTNAGRYCSAVSGGKMVRFQISINVEAKTIAFKTQSVIELTTTTPSDASSGTSFSGDVYLEG